MLTTLTHSNTSMRSVPLNTNCDCSGICGTASVTVNSRIDQHSQAGGRTLTRRAVRSAPHVMPRSRLNASTPKASLRKARRPQGRGQEDDGRRHHCASSRKLTFHGHKRFPKTAHFQRPMFSLFCLIHTKEATQYQYDTWWQRRQQGNHPHRVSARAELQPSHSSHVALEDMDVFATTHIPDANVPVERSQAHRKRRRESKARGECRHGTKGAAPPSPVSAAAGHEFPIIRRGKCKNVVVVEPLGPAGWGWLSLRSTAGGACAPELFPQTKQ